MALHVSCQNTPPSAINNISWENLEPSEREYYEKLLERVKEQARDLSYREPKENLKKIKVKYKAVNVLKVVTVISEIEAM